MDLDKLTISELRKLAEAMDIKLSTAPSGTIYTKDQLINLISKSKKRKSFIEEELEQGEVIKYLGRKIILTHIFINDIETRKYFYQSSGENSKLPNTWFPIEGVKILDNKSWFKKGFFDIFGPNGIDKSSDDFQFVIYRDFRNPPKNKLPRYVYYRPELRFWIIKVGKEEYNLFDIISRCGNSLTYLTVSEIIGGGIWDIKQFGFLRTYLIKDINVHIPSKLVFVRKLPKSLFLEPEIEEKEEELFEKSSVESRCIIM